MPLQAAHAQAPTGRPPEHVAEALEVVAAGHGEPVRGQRADAIPIAGPQRGLQERFDGGDKRLLRILEQEHAAAAQQVRETGLMSGVVKLPIRLPAVALQHAGIVDADDCAACASPRPG